MNESMRSVADIPGDDTVDDDLSGISPELVLIDPELARLVRERQASETPSSALRVPTLRLVEGGSEQAPIVPRTVETVASSPTAPIVGGVASSVPEPLVERSVRQRVVEPSVPDPVVEERPEEIVVASSALTPMVEEPVLDVLPIPEAGPLVRRVIDAEPARAVPPVEVEEPAPPVPDRLADITVPPPEPTPRYSTMPHPVTRPATQPRSRASVRKRKRGMARTVLAFLLAVAIAAAAVLGITRLTQGSSESPLERRGTAAVGAPPVAATSSGKTKVRSAKKAAAKRPSVASKTKPKPEATKPATTTKTSGAEATTKPKTSVASKPKTGAAAKSKPTTARPKPTTAKPKASTTPPKKTPVAAAAAETRRFAWAPVDGAVGYHVELFRGNDRVLARDTKEPVLELAPSWRYQGRTVTLKPGEYRWYVWPVTSSGRGTEAVVQAKLTV